MSFSRKPWNSDTSLHLQNQNLVEKKILWLTTTTLSKQVPVVQDSLPSSCGEQSFSSSSVFRMQQSRHNAGANHSTSWPDLQNASCAARSKCIIPDASNRIAIFSYSLFLSTSHNHAHLHCPKSRATATAPIQCRRIPLFLPAIRPSKQKRSATKTAIHCNPVLRS